MTDHDDVDSGRKSLTPEEFVRVTDGDASKNQDRYQSFTCDSDDELDGFPTTPNERLLRILASNPEKPRTHEDFVERTNLDSDMITNALARLEAQGLVANRGGRYFIPESRQSTVDGLLTVTRQLRASTTESAQERSISEFDPESADV